MSPELLPLVEDWSSAMAVVAHPDDLEYGAAAAVARWTNQGKRMTYCLATSGEAGIDGMEPEIAGPLREAEERASAAVVGVHEVAFLGHPDGVLEYGIPLRRDLARAIRRQRPDVIVTTNFRSTFISGALNQADHVALGRALVDAVRDAGNRWVHRELTAEGLEPWNGVRSIVVVGSPRSTHAVEVDDHFETGLASLKEHQAYLSGLGDGRSFDELAEVLRARGGAVGRRLGCRYAVPCEVLTL